MHTVLRAASEKAEYVSMAADDFHHFHLLNQVGHVAVAAVVCNNATQYRLGLQFQTEIYLIYSASTRSTS